MIYSHMDRSTFNKILLILIEFFGFKISGGDFIRYIGQSSHADSHIKSAWFVISIYSFNYYPDNNNKKDKTDGKAPY